MFYKKNICLSIFFYYICSKYIFMKNKEEALEHIRVRVKELCRERKKTLKDLASEIGMQPDSLQRSLNNNSQFSTLCCIAENLGVEVGDLLETTKDKLNPYNIHAIITYNNKVYMAEGLDPLISTIKEIVADVDSVQEKWQEIHENPKLIK